MKFEDFVNFYDYKLPKNLIAQKPTKKRDEARLLVYSKEKDNILYSNFKNITEFLPKNSVLVFNETKVIPARLVFEKETGGRVETLYITTEGKQIKVLSNRKLAIGAKLFINKNIEFTVGGSAGKYYLIKPDFNINKIEDVIQKYGKTPLPPYLKNSPLLEKARRKMYQTVFAKNNGSIAAPTASLHFTKQSLVEIKKAGIKIKFITLHVGLGTFAPLEEGNFKTGKLHQEIYCINKTTASYLNKAKSQGKPIIAVGTTVTRALESATKNGLIEGGMGTTNLFIRDDYNFKFVDGLITNFHVPKSSLLMLVSAFIGRDKLFYIYKKAINKKFKFYSFGDGMLIY